MTIEQLIRLPAGSSVVWVGTPEERDLGDVADAGTRGTVVLRGGSVGIRWDDGIVSRRIEGLAPGIEVAAPC